jgi:hypothetical protein
MSVTPRKGGVNRQGSLTAPFGFFRVFRRTDVLSSYPRTVGVRTTTLTKAGGG